MMRIGPSSLLRSIPKISMIKGHWVQKSGLTSPKGTSLATSGPFAREARLRFCAYSRKLHITNGLCFVALVMSCLRAWGREEEVFWQEDWGQEFACFPPIILDDVSSFWAVRGGNDLLAPYIPGLAIPQILLVPQFSGGASYLIS